VNALLPLTFDLVLSLLILLLAANIYVIYRRQYLVWFLVVLFLTPFLFLYSFFEMMYLSDISPYFVVPYPFILIFVEVAIIIAQKNLLASLKTEKGAEYKLLLREDVALIRAFEKIANHFIRRMSPFVGIKNVEQILEECIEQYPILSGCYIGSDERLKVQMMEELIGEQKEVNMNELCTAFSYLLTKLIDSYSALVPYNEIVEELSHEIGKIDRRVIAYLIPFILFKMVLEPFIRELRGDELKKLRMSIDIAGVHVNRKGGLEYHTIYAYDETAMEEKFITFLIRLLAFSGRDREIKGKVMEFFRKLPQNVKEEMYRRELIKKLPPGILDEEKMVLSSKEKLIEELIDRKQKLEEAYARLADAKLNKMKSEFIDIIAHELKTPLTTIKTYTDLLRKEKLGPLNEVQREKLERMEKNIKRLTKLIDDMLQIPSIDAKELELRKELFPAQEVIDAIVEEVEEIAREKKQAFTVEIDGDAIIFGDKNLIEKAIKNIVVNAVKYTPEKGAITLTAKREGDFIRISVADTGRGIRSEDAEKIFEPFYSLESGAGLGLSIAKNIVESHGGKIWVESTVGKGSQFHILLRGEK